MVTDRGKALWCHRTWDEGHGVLSAVLGRLEDVIGLEACHGYNCTHGSVDIQVNM